MTALYCHAPSVVQVIRALIAEEAQRGHTQQQIDAVEQDIATIRADAAKAEQTMEVSMPAQCCFAGCAMLTSRGEHGVALGLGMQDSAACAACFVSLTLLYMPHPCILQRRRKQFALLLHCVEDLQRVHDDDQLDLADGNQPMQIDAA